LHESNFLLTYHTTYVYSYIAVACACVFEECVETTYSIIAKIKWGVWKYGGEPLLR